MSVLDRDRNASAEPGTAPVDPRNASVDPASVDHASGYPGNASVDPAVTEQQDLAGSTVSAPAGRVPRTRTGAAWFGICTAAVASVVLIIFMLQNTGSVEVTFLWMHGTVPLALALLIAGVGVAILAIAVGVARTTQLRRQSRRRR